MKYFIKTAALHTSYIFLNWKSGRATQCMEYSTLETKQTPSQFFVQKTTLYRSNTKPSMQA